MNLKNSTVLVTGASSGIGQAIAIELARAGAEVLINYRGNKQGAEQTLKIVLKYSKGTIYQADLTDLAQINKMFEQISSDYQQVDILINNAGQAEGADFKDQDMWSEQWKNIFMSAVLTTNRFLDLYHTGALRKVINISSLYGEFNSGSPDLVQYSVAKAAMHSWAMNMAKKLAPEVLVNCVAPGWTMTPTWAGVSKKELEMYTGRTCIKRFIKPEEVAQVVAFLAINDAMTGEIVHIDGGARLTDFP